MQINENVWDFSAERESFHNLILSNHHISLCYAYSNRNSVSEFLILVFKMQLDRALDNLIEAPFPKKGWIRWSFKVPSSLGSSMMI